jgi:hypothetical protein
MVYPNLTLTADFANMMSPIARLVAPHHIARRHRTDTTTVWPSPPTPSFSRKGQWRFPAPALNPNLVSNALDPPRRRGNLMSATLTHHEEEDDTSKKNALYPKL